ncbi:hypothetical protein [Nitrosopumilus ureiphilus]|nr:hypothetical protein [Nitrosopumilus ureiphilus]
MAKRITVVLDDDTLKKLRLLQAKIIKNKNANVSFSKVINLVLTKSL